MPESAGKPAVTRRTAAASTPDALDALAAPAPEAVQEPAPDPSDALAAEPEADTSGWFRNTSATELTVLPDRYPSAKISPDEATWLPADPRHPNLERCDAPDGPAADTPRSEK